MAGGTEALKRRIERLAAREDAMLRALMPTLTPDEWRRVNGAMRAIGVPLPAGDDPWALPEAEQGAYVAALEALAHRRLDRETAAREDRTLRAVLWSIWADRRAAENGREW